MPGTHSIYRCLKIEDKVERDLMCWRKPDFPDRRFVPCTVMEWILASGMQRGLVTYLPRSLRQTASTYSAPVALILVGFCIESVSEIARFSFGIKLCGFASKAHRTVEGFVICD